MKRKLVCAVLWAMIQCGFLAMLPLSAVAGGNSPVHGLWVWKSALVLADPREPARLLDFSSI